MGAGAAKRVSAVRWGVAGNMVTAWILTFPMAAAIGALTYGVTQIFSNEVVGPVLIFTGGLLLSVIAFIRRSRTPVPV